MNATSCPDFADLLWQAETGDASTLNGHDPAACHVCAERLHEWEEMRKILKPLAPLLNQEGLTPAPELADHLAAAAAIAHLSASVRPGTDLGEIRRLLVASRSAQNTDRNLALSLAEQALEGAQAQHAAARRGFARLAEALLAGAESSCGYALARVGRVEEGLVLLEKSVIRWRGLGDPLGEASALGNLAIAQNLAKNLPAATRAMRSALHLFLSLGQANEAAVARRDLAIFLGDQGHVGAAIREARQAAHEFSRLNQPEHRARSLQWVAWQLVDMGELREGCLLAEESERVLLRAGDVVDAAKCGWVRGRALARSKPGSNETRSALESALRTFVAKGLWLEAALVRCDLLRDALQAGNQPAALSRLAEIEQERPADLRNAWIDEALAILRKRMETTPLTMTLLPLVDELNRRLAIPAPVRMDHH